MSEVSVNVYCRFRPINTLERTTWESNRIITHLKQEDLQHLAPQFKQHKNKKYKDPKKWKKLAQNTKLLKKHFTLTPNDILRFQRLVQVDVSDWDEDARFLQENLGVTIYPEANTIGTLDAFGHSRTFSFDKVLWLDTSQQQAFSTIGLPMMKDALRGINGTLVAFGQTGSGKTFSSFGPEPITNAPFEMLGIIPLSFSYLFEAAARDETVTNLIVEIEVVEIYLGRLRDLLEPKDLKTKRDKLLKLREVDDVIEEPGGKKKKPAKRRQVRKKGKKGKKGKKKAAKEKKVIPKKMAVVGSFQAAANTVEDIQVLIAKSTENRSKNETEMNKSSSRSHLIMRAKILQHKTDGSYVHCYLTFCDLAGSEKVRKTNVVGEQLQEAKDINLQLSTLRDVIDSVVKKKKFIPFKNSMLTRVLKYSLIGNVKTSILVCCSPHIWNQSETLSGLQFGATCKLIKNKVVVNKEYTKAELVKKLKALEAEYKIMKENLRKAKMKEFAGFLANKSTNEKGQQDGSGSDFSSQVAQMQVEMDSLQRQLQDAQEELEQERLEFADKIKEMNRNSPPKETLKVDASNEGGMVDENLLEGLEELKIHMTNKHAIGMLEELLSRAGPAPASRKLSFEFLPEPNAIDLRINQTQEDSMDKHIKFHGLGEKLSTLRGQRKLRMMMNPTGDSSGFSVVDFDQPDGNSKLASLIKMGKTPSDTVLAINPEKTKRNKDLRSIVQAQSEWLKGTMMNLVDEDELDDDDLIDFNSDYSEFDEESCSAISASEISSPGSDTEEPSISHPHGIQYKMKGKAGQPTLSDPILDLVANLNDDNINELRIFLRGKRREKDFELNFKSLNDGLNTWKISDIAAFWVTLSCQQQKKVRIIDAMGFVSRLEHYLTKQFVAKKIESELGGHAEQFRQILSTIPSITFSEIDLNGDDRIHIEELTRCLKTTERLVVERLFKALDENEDGYVSRMEFDILKTNLEKDLAGGIDESQRQKRFDFSELFHTLIPNLSSVYSKSGFVDENGGLTEKGASHILHLLRNTTPGGLTVASDLGMLYLIGLREDQIVALMCDVPQQIWHQLVEHPEEN